MIGGKNGIPGGKILAVLFIIGELVLFPFIQLTPADVSSFCSYLAIVLAALFAIFVCKCKREENLIRLGILFTLVADYFLVLCNDAQLPGVISFIFVQGAYFAYLFIREERKTVRKANVITRVALSAMLSMAAFAVLGKDADVLSVVSVIYYANLLSNIVFAFLLGREERIFSVGLVLFAMCDLCIGLEVLFSSYLDSSALSFFYGSNINLPWMFYQPSQVLIALNIFCKHNRK